MRPATFTASPSACAPRVAYLLAVAAGLVGLPFMRLSVEHLGLARVYPLSVLFIAASFALGYAALGAAFGSLWPRVGWRWGVWLCAAPSCAVPYFAPDWLVFLGWATVALLPACGGADAAGRLAHGGAGAP